MGLSPDEYTRVREGTLPSQLMSMYICNTHLIVFIIFFEVLILQGVVSQRNDAVLTAARALEEASAMEGIVRCMRYDVALSGYTCVSICIQRRKISDLKLN